MVSIKELRTMLQTNEQALRTANLALQFGQIKASEVTQLLNHREFLKDELIRQLENELEKKAKARREYQSTRRAG